MQVVNTNICVLIKTNIVLRNVNYNKLFYVCLCTYLYVIIKVLRLKYYNNSTLGL